MSLDKLFNKATSSAMTKKTSIVEGLDGVTYYFYKKSETGIISCGECWSPSHETALFELVNICDLLIDYAVKGTNDIDNLIDRIAKLYTKIE